MPFRLLINGGDYSQFVHRRTQVTRIKWEINKPQILEFALVSIDETFGGLGAPSRDDSVVIDTTKYGDAAFHPFISGASSTS